MRSRSLFLKLDSLEVESVVDAMATRDFIDSFICYNVMKIIVDNSYPQMNILYNYNPYKIVNSPITVENLYVIESLRDSLISLNNLFRSNIEDVIHEFYISGYSNTGSLNLNSILLNNSCLLITYEFYSK